MEESNSRDSLSANTSEGEFTVDMSLENSPAKDQTFLPNSIQASESDDQSLPLYLLSQRNLYSTMLRNEQHSQIVASESGGRTASFPGRRPSSAVQGEAISDQITSTPITEAGLHIPAMVIGKSPSSLQYGDEVEAMITGIMKNCNPVILALLVTNDNKSKPLIATSEASRGLESNEPPLNSEKSCAILKTELEASGIMVIPVINRPKEYLEAVLLYLKSMKMPKSCKFFWFIFSGHGSSGAFTVNGESMSFENLMQLVSKINVTSMAFVFECCQRYGDTISAAKIEKQYTAVYSSPPDKVSYHYEGVGLLTTCLAKMLKDGLYKKSFSELQNQLCRDVVKMIEEVVPIPAHIQKDKFITEHVPVQMTKMCDNFSIWSEISAAMEPSIDVHMTSGNHEAVITVSNPRRIIYHPSNSKFELRKNVIVLKNDEHKLRVTLATLEAKFEEDDSLALHQTVVIPPQSCEMSGNLVVGAEYGDGRVEYSKSYSIDRLPCYEKPQIDSCVLEASQCEVSVKFTPNNTHKESDYYHIEWVQIGFHDSSSNWKMLYHKDGYDYTSSILAMLPLSRELVRRDLQVAVKYIKCPTPIYSEPYTVEQLAIGAPYDVSTSYGNYPSLSVSWKGPDGLPADGDFEFKIVADTPQEKELGSAPFNVHCIGIEVPRSFNSPIKVGICHRSRKDLGIIYSAPHKENVVLRQLSEISCCHKILVLLVLAFSIILLASLPLLIISLSKTSLNNQLIVANQTMSFKPKWHDLYFRSGITVHENIIEFSDNPFGLNITGYLVNSNAMKLVNVTVQSKEYAGTDQLIHGGSTIIRSLIPDNYLNYPQNLLTGSTIILKTKINIQNKGILVHHAQIDYFESLEMARRYKENGGLPLKRVHTVNVTNCVYTTCLNSFSVQKESFYFFVLTSNVTSMFNITTNFTFHAVRYAHPNTHSGAINVTHISKDLPGFIPFHTSKEILLYADFPKSGLLNICHLNFITGHLQDSPLSLFFLIFLASTFCAFLLLIIILGVRCYKSYRNRLQCGVLMSGSGHEDSNETTRLLTSQPRPINS